MYFIIMIINHKYQICIIKALWPFSDVVSILNMNRKEHEEEDVDLISVSVVVPPHLGSVDSVFQYCL